MTSRRSQRKRQTADIRKLAGTSVTNFNMAWDAFRQYLATLDWVALNTLRKRINSLRHDKTRKNEVDWVNGLAISDAEMTGRIMQPGPRGGTPGTGVPSAYFDEIDRRCSSRHERPTTVARDVVTRNREMAARNEQTLKHRVDYIVKLWKTRNRS